MILKSVGVFSCGKIYCLISAAFGLIAGSIFTFFAFLGTAFGTVGEPGAAFFSVLFGIGAILFMPLFYGFFGFLGGVIFAALYNFFAGLVGGVELEFEYQGKPGV